MTAPLVSVVVPVRDEAPFLSGALRSLSAQTLTDFEVLIVDDGSEDASADIAAAHAEADDRFRLLRRARAGIVPALQWGLANAHGRYVARMDGDDVALPERLESQVAALEAEGLGACGGRVACFPERFLADGARRYERWINSLVTAELAARDVFVECPIPHPALLVRRDVLDAIGAYRDRGWPEDYDLVLRLWASGTRFRNVEQVVLRWRDHPARVSRTGSAYTEDAFARCKASYLQATVLHPFDGVVVWGAGPVGKRIARALARVGVRIAGFVDVDPRKIGKTIYGASVIAVEDAPRFSWAFALGAVAGLEARNQIRETVTAQGRREGVDFLAVA